MEWLTPGELTGTAWGVRDPPWITVASVREENQDAEPARLEVRSAALDGACEVGAVQKSANEIVVIAIAMVSRATAPFRLRFMVNL